MDDQELVIEPSKRKLLVSLAVLLACFAFGVFTAVIGSIAGWFLMIVIGCLLPFSLLSLSPGRIELKLNREGVEFTTILKRFNYKWSDIEGDFYLDRMLGREMVYFRYRARHPKGSLYDFAWELHGKKGAFPNVFEETPQALCQKLNLWKNTHTTHAGQGS